MGRNMPVPAILAAFLSTSAAADVTTAEQRAKAGEFVAMGDILCAQEVGEPLVTCRAEVARANGAASVVVTFGNGFARRLRFADGAFLRGNATMSGVGTDMEWDLSDGIFTIRVDDQRFEIPRALVFGN